MREALAKDPEAHRARLKLVWMLLEAGRVDEAEEEFQKIPGPMRDQGDGMAIKQRLMLKKQGTDLDAARREVEAHPDDPDAHLRLARALAAEERWDEACAAYIEAMRRDRGKIRDEARQGLLQVFEVLGGRGPIVDRWREEMARILFS
ncbi:MAG: hypothetical protein D6771_06790 [Zetaproteobacteria bacterium]|nr:MAG: hypothetical protein D6771_06790 [Zetaproteobacteria bacterium]